MSKLRFAVSLTPAADRDMDEILAYAVANFSKADAAILLREILKKIGSLAQFPDRGSIPLELVNAGEQRYRQLVHRHYRIIYRRIDQQVVVYLIADGRRDMQTLFDQRLMAD